MPNTIHSNQKRTVKEKKQVSLDKKKDFLTSDEVTKLLQHAGNTRYAVRDQALILITFRHGLRASEAVNLRWNQINLITGKIMVHRLKDSDDSIQVLEQDEIRMLRKIQKENPNSQFVFMTERGNPMNADGFLKMIKRCGVAAGFDFPVHPHMLRHGAGHALASAGASTRHIQDFLGHKNIRHTVRYTKLNNQAFFKFGKLIGGRLK